MAYSLCEAYKSWCQDKSGRIKVFKAVKVERQKHVWQQSFENKTKYGEDMPTEGEGGSAKTPQAQTAPTARVLNFTSNFRFPSPMKVPGYRVTYWEFLRQQWEDYELGTGIEHRHFDQSCMGKDCLQIFLNLNLKLTQEDKASVTASLAALKKYLKPTRDSCSTQLSKIPKRE